MLHFSLMSQKFSPGFFLHVQYSFEALTISFTGFSVVSSTWGCSVSCRIQSGP